MFNNFVIYAAEGAQPAAGSVNNTSAMVTTLLVYGGLILVFYWLVIKPQKKKAKDHSQLISELKEGDTVITTGGIKGEIVAVTDDFFELRIDKGVKITIKKNYIQGLYQ